MAVGLIPVKRPWPVAAKLLRAFFFEKGGGLKAFDSAQNGQTATLDSGVTRLQPFGVNIPRTNGVDVNLDNDRGALFEINKVGDDPPVSLFYHFRFDGNTTSSEEFTLSSNTTATGEVVYGADVANSVIEDGLIHTLLLTYSRNGGFHVYLDAAEIHSDTSPNSVNEVNSHLVRYDASANQWELRFSNATGGNRRDLMIGGTPQKAQDRWDGPIYGFLAWNRKLSAGEAVWLHHNYRLLKEPRTTWFPIGVAATGTEFFQTVLGDLTPAGAQTRFIAISPSGLLAPAGTIVRDTQTSLAGAVVPSGTIVRKTLKSLAGSLVPSGALAAISLFFRPLTGALAPVGALIRETQKKITGVVTPASASTRLVSKPIAGSVVPTGAMAKLTSKSFAGSLTPTGAFSAISIFLRTLVGAVTPTATIVREIQKQVAGSITPIGVDTKLTSKSFSGNVTPTGVISVTFTKVLSGIVAVAGALGTLFIAAGGGTGFTDPRGQWPGLPRSAGEWVAFITAAGGTTTGDLASDARVALATVLSISEADALNYSMNDLWKRYELAGFPNA